MCLSSFCAPTKRENSRAHIHIDYTGLDNVSKLIKMYTRLYFEKSSLSKIEETHSEKNFLLLCVHVARFLDRVRERVNTHKDTEIEGEK